MQNKRFSIFNFWPVFLVVAAIYLNSAIPLTELENNWTQPPQVLKHRVNIEAQQKPIETPELLDLKPQMEELSPENIPLDASVSAEFMGTAFEGSGSGASGLSAFHGDAESGGDSRNLKIKVRTALAYPDIARKKGISGFVKIRINVNAQGKVVSTEILEAQPLGIFENASVQAVKSWSYEPAMKEGRLIAASMVQRIIFNLE